MPAISVERTIAATKRAVLGGLIRYNGEKLGRQKHRQFAISLRDKAKIVGGVVGEVWMSVLFIQFFWIEERFRGKGHGKALIEKIEDPQERLTAVATLAAEESRVAMFVGVAVGFELARELMTTAKED